jgi:hypothetical protein
MPSSRSPRWTCRPMAPSPTGCPPSCRNRPGDRCHHRDRLGGPAGRWHHHQPAVHPRATGHPETAGGLRRPPPPRRGPRLVRRADEFSARLAPSILPRHDPSKNTATWSNRARAPIVSRPFLLRIDLLVTERRPIAADRARHVRVSRNGHLRSRDRGRPTYVDAGLRRTFGPAPCAAHYEAFGLPPRPD